MTKQIKIKIIFILFLLVMLLSSCTFVENSNAEIQDLAAGIEQVVNQIMVWFGGEGGQCEPVLASPEIKFLDVENVAGTDNLRYTLGVENSERFPNRLFVDAPDLPPCGENEASSRTWISIHNAENDMYIYGFCAMDDMPTQLWFAGQAGQYPAVYIDLHDRKCDHHYISNVIEIPQAIPLDDDLAEQDPDCFTDLPMPEIQYAREEDIEGSDATRYFLEIVNWDQFPNELFVNAPELPPCGNNANASRTWITIYSTVDFARIYGFCALSEMPAEIWFAGQPGQYPSVYIDLHDRKCDIHYPSNYYDMP